MRSITWAIVRSHLSLFVALCLTVGCYVKYLPLPQTPSQTEV